MNAIQKWFQGRDWKVPHTVNIPERKRTILVAHIFLTHDKLDKTTRRRKRSQKRKKRRFTFPCGCLIEEPAVFGGGGQQSHVLQMTMEMVMMRMVTATMGREMVMRMVAMMEMAMMMMMVSAFGPAIICPYGQPRSPAKWLKLHQESTFIHHLPLSASKPQTRCIWIVD